MATQTFGTTRNEVKSNLLLSSTVEDARIDQAIRTAIRQLSNKRYYFLKKSIEIGNGAGGLSFSAPTDFNIFDSADVVNGGNLYPLEIMTYSDLRYRYFPIQSRSYPCAIALNDNVFYLSHSVQTSCTIGLHYYKKDVALPVNFNDTSVFLGDEAYDTVVSLAQYFYELSKQGNLTADKTLIDSFLNKLNRDCERRANIW